MLRLLALDIDGTLLDSDGRIPTANHHAVARAIDAGIEVVLATGRRYDSARPIFEALPDALGDTADPLGGSHRRPAELHDNHAGVSPATGLLRDQAPRLEQLGVEDRGSRCPAYGVVDEGLQLEIVDPVAAETLDPIAP